MTRRSWFISKLRTLSCEHYTELASQSMDRPLSVKEKLSFRLHHAICMVCRRYNRQINLIQRAAIRLSEREAQLEKQAESSDITLSEEAKEKIISETTKEIKSNNKDFDR